jgi:hypothetical protein
MKHELIRLLEGIVFMGCGLFASFTFWRSGSLREMNGSKNEKTGKMRIGGKTMAKQARIRRSGSVGTTENQGEWIPLNRHRRASSIITTIHHPVENLNRTRRPFASLFLTPTFFFLIFSFSAVISGSLVGWAIAALYNAAFLRMSTWVPALWSAGLTLIVVISSYSNISTVL